MKAAATIQRFSPMQSTNPPVRYSTAQNSTVQNGMVVYTYTIHFRNCGNVRRGSYLRGRAAGEAARENETESQDIVIIYLRERERINGVLLLLLLLSYFRLFFY